MGSSSRNTSKRASRIAARFARAAWPPESAGISRSSTASAQAEVGAAPRRPGRRSRRRRARGTRRARRAYASSAPGRCRRRARGSRRVERALGVGHAGAPGEVRAHGLAGAPLGLLREVADGRGRRRPGRRGPASGALDAGEDPQQRGLARCRSARRRRSGCCGPDRARSRGRARRADRTTWSDVTGDEAGERIARTRRTKTRRHLRSRAGGKGSGRAGSLHQRAG